MDQFAAVTSAVQVFDTDLGRFQAIRYYDPFLG